jgi:hypothetical protein
MATVISQLTFSRLLDQEAACPAHYSTFASCVGLSEYGMALSDFHASVLADRLWAEVEIYGLTDDQLFLATFVERTIELGDPRVAFEHALDSAMVGQGGAR